MKKIFILSLLIISINNYAATDHLKKADFFWPKRHTKEMAFKAISLYEKAAHHEKKNPEALWKYARSVFFYSRFFLTNKTEQKKYFIKGYSIANKALAINPHSNDALYYATICLAFISSIERSLSKADKVKEMLQILMKNDSMYKTSAHRLMGRLHFKLPPWPLSFGNDDKSIKYIRLALKLGKNRPFKYHRYSYLYLAEVLLDEGEKEEAKQLVNQGLALPVKNEAITEEKEVIENLQKLKKKLSE